MTEVSVFGPQFNIETNRVFIALGNSERRRIGEGLAQALHELRIFTHIDTVPLNKMAGFVTRGAFRDEAKRRFVIGHSAALTRLPHALQVAAINPPEPTSVHDLIVRANKLTKEKVAKEPTAWESGPKDLALAAFELGRSPFTSARTPHMIAGGFSSVDYLINGEERFPAGRALVHSANDVFGFQKMGDLRCAGDNGVTAFMLPDHSHMSLLLEPKRTVGLLTPAIFPMPWGTTEDLLTVKD